MINYYDKEGKPLDLFEWAKIFSDYNYKIIAVTKISYLMWSIRISTVWLGLDHSWDGGPPLIFETMIFGGPLEEYQWRYSTEEEAKRGHKKAVRAARLGHLFKFMEWIK